MKIKDVALNELHWTIQQWNPGPQANDRLRQLLGDDSRFFARLSTGADHYFWDDNLPWQPFNTASPEHTEAIRRQWEALKAHVTTKLASDSILAEHITEIPNEDYLFYRANADGTVSLLVTGWGFRNFKKAGPHRFEQPKEIKGHAVDVCFTSNGAKIPARQFFVVAKQTRNELYTNDEGTYRLGDHIEAGKEIDIIDGPTGKKFHIIVDEKLTEYALDVTPEKVDEPQPRLIRVTVLDQNGKPFKEQPIIFAQGSLEESEKLDEKGSIIFDTLSFDATKPLTARLTDQPLPPIEFTLDEGETEYVLQQAAPKKKSRVKEIVAAIIILVALAGIAVATKYGVDALQPIINKNILS